MRRLLWIAGLVVLLLAAIGTAAALLIDAESLRAPLRRAASDALGRDVQIGEMRLSLLPRPGVEARDVRVAGTTDTAPAFAEVEALRLRVALLPLLVGRVLVDTLEVDGPRVRVPLDASGAPILPAPRAPGGKDAAREEAAEPAPSDGRTRPALAIDALRVRDGHVEYGDWTVSELQVDGSVGLDGRGSARVRGDARGPAELDGFDVDARFAADPATLELRELVAELAVASLAWASDGTVLRGPARGSAELGGAWSLQLDDTELRVPGAVRKQRGVPLRLDGKLGPQLSSLLQGPVDLRVADARVQLHPDLERRRVSVSGAPLQLAALHALLDPELPRPTGTLQLDGLGVQLEGTRLFGAARLEDVRVDTPGGAVVVTGTLRGEGRRLLLREARAEIGGEPVVLDGSYDLDSGLARIESRTSGVQLGALLAALGAEPNLQGLLASDMRLQISPAGGLPTLSGSGRIDLSPGSLKGFSLLRQVLGKLAAVPALVALARGKDLSRYEEEAFEQLAGDFSIERGVLSSRNLLLRYKHATAHLNGSVGLATGGALDLRGRVELAREVEAEFGKPGGSPTVIPITHIGGTLERPRVEIDRDTLAQVALAYAGSGRVREKLDEKLGPGAADAVEGLLDRLRGGR